MARKAVVYVVALAVACSGAVLAGRQVAERLDDRLRTKVAATTATTVVVVRPPAGQVMVTGTVEAFAADNVQGPPLATPFTISVLDRGQGNATIEKALIDGERTNVFWGGGAPLPITGEGGIDLSGSRIDVDASGALWSPTGAARSLTPGTYRAGGAVGVGEEGLARPRESVAFEADAQTVLNATKGVAIQVGPSLLKLSGPGHVALTGRMRVVESTGERDATRIELAGGPYEVTLEPVEGEGLRIVATFQGPYRVT